MRFSGNSETESILNPEGSGIDPALGTNTRQCKFLSQGLRDSTIRISAPREASRDVRVRVSVVVHRRRRRHRATAVVQGGRRHRTVQKVVKKAVNYYKSMSDVITGHFCGLCILWPKYQFHGRMYLVRNPPESPMRFGGGRWPMLPERGHPDPDNPEAVPAARSRCRTTWPFCK